MRALTASFVVAAGLILAACDAGPSAVVHDGDGQSPKAAQAPAKRPAWAAASSMPAPATNHYSDAPSPAAKDVEHAIPEEVKERDDEVAKAYPPLPVGERGEISETKYGDWPLWSKTRKYSPSENSHNAFDKHGQEVGAKSYEDYMAMVHHFVHTPPKGTETMTRANGDVLMFNAKSDVFAVITKTGAPRTLFRPFDGQAYWQKQQSIEATHAGGDGGE